MKKYFLILISFIFLVSCDKNGIKEPDNLIEKDKVVDIIYDLTILQAMRGNFQAKLDSNKISAADYIYKKYKVDSLQFANSNRYYATDVASYNRMYNRVTERLAAEKTKADNLAAKESANQEKSRTTEKATGPTQESRSKE